MVFFFVSFFFLVFFRNKKRALALKTLPLSFTSIIYHMLLQTTTRWYSWMLLLTRTELPQHLKRNERSDLFTTRSSLLLFHSILRNFSKNVRGNDIFLSWLNISNKLIPVNPSCPLCIQIYSSFKTYLWSYFKKIVCSCFGKLQKPITIHPWLKGKQIIY